MTLDGVSVGYDGKPVLKGLNLRLDQDDRIALLGRNGEGKTTLAKLLSDRLKPMAGEITAARAAEKSSAWRDLKKAPRRDERKGPSSAKACR